MTIDLTKDQVGAVLKALEWAIEDDGFLEVFVEEGGLEKTLFDAYASINGSRHAYEQP